MLDITGLDNFRAPYPKHRKPLPLGSAKKPTPKLGSGPGGTFAGMDYRMAYAPGVTLDGSGQSVGLLISPARGFVAIGPPGGPFNISVQSFSLTSSTANSVDWTISTPPSWLNISPSRGSLGPDAPEATVTASLSAAADQLTQGVYVANL